MRKYKITYTLTYMMGTFTDVVESDSDDDKVLKKKLNDMVKAEGLKTNGKSPRVRQILLVETLKDGDVADPT